MIPSSLQASIDRKNLSVASEMYTTCRVAVGCLACAEQVMRRAMAPNIPMEFWLAALIFIEVGVR